MVIQKLYVTSLTGNFKIITQRAPLNFTPLSLNHFDRLYLEILSVKQQYFTKEEIKHSTLFLL